jgi:hypothetical protein
MEDKCVKFVIVGQGSKSRLACIARGLTDQSSHWEWQVSWLNPASPPNGEQKLLYKLWAEQLRKRQ